MKWDLRRKWMGFSERLQEDLEIPKSALPGLAQIELAGNREAVVDGCRGVLQYDDSVVRLSTGQLIVRFTGSDLTIRTMQQNQIQISGTIVSVDFTA